MVLVQEPSEEIEKNRLDFVCVTILRQSALLRNFHISNSRNVMNNLKRIAVLLKCEFIQWGDWWSIEGDIYQITFTGSFLNLLIWKTIQNDKHIKVKEKL